MFKSTAYFGNWLNRMLLRGSNILKLNWLVSGCFISQSKLAFLVHAPSIHIAPCWKCYSKLLAHLNVFDHRDYILLSISSYFSLSGFSPCAGTLLYSWCYDLFFIIPKGDFSWKLANAFEQQLSSIFLFFNSWIVPASSPLVHRSVT